MENIDAQLLLVLQETSKLIEKSRKATDNQHFEDARDRFAPNFVFSYDYYEMFSLVASEVLLSLTSSDIPVNTTTFSQHVIRACI